MIPTGTPGQEISFLVANLITIMVPTLPIGDAQRCWNRARRRCFPSRPALPCRNPRSRRRSRPTPERVPKLGRDMRGSAGRVRAASDAPARSPAERSRRRAHTGAETCSGVGRVARRARPVIKPYSRPLPRLTLKAGHKEGLPTIPIAACAAYSTGFRAAPLFKRTHPQYWVFISCVFLTEYH
jgi:hypothetical protein